MSRFMNKQLTHAEAKKLGRVENHWSYDPVTGRGTSGQHRCDAAERPPNTMVHASPVGRSRGIAIPGSEADGETYSPPDYATAPSPIKKRRR